ncbi:MAG: PD-(D/E)XK nuclease family protein [Allomuricauda sp.]|nr:MAG: PD-(D/E)XK nuclease family protein [Allomuricauda sp.]
MFLKEVISDLNTDAPDWEKIVLILPSNRSIREFKKLLAQEIKTPVFSPKFYSIEDFVAKVSGLSLCEPLELQLRLFESYCKINPTQQEPYSGFAGWASSVLSDFNEIDRYLLPPEKIFNYLTAVSSIKNWTPDAKPTLLISEYTRFIKNLGKLYSEANRSLSELGLGYQGMLYRHAVKNIDTFVQKHSEFSFKVIGLNALNKAEKTIIDKLLTLPNSKAYWDLDTMFIEDKQHSAGYFMRQNLSFFSHHRSKQKQFSENEFLKNKTIKITGVPKNSSQAKYVSELLRAIDFEQGPVALVLSDETLLPAILHAIPELGVKVNITMGYPIKRTHSYAFLRSILELRQTKKETGYYYKEVQSFLGNPVLSCLVEEEDIVSFDKEIRQKNDVYIARNKLQRFIQSQEILSTIINEPQSVTKELESFSALFSFLTKSKQLQSNEIEIESCTLMVSALSQLSSSLNHLTQKLGFKDIEALMDGLLREKTIAFRGDPNEGLQIMGLLETRSLDFDTVIMTSVNEGVLPTGKSYNSFIPFDIKSEFGLPTIKEKDAVYTYHFYRLLQRAEKVHLIYNTEPDVLKGGEPSRFIRQLATHQQIQPFVQHNFASPKITSNKASVRKIEKTELLLEQLKLIASKGLSPSSLSKYIRNPFEFYKQYVLGIETPENVDEDVAYNVMGSIIHDSLEKIYEPFVGKIVAPQAIESVETNLETIIFSEFENYYSKNAILKGKNLIVFQVVYKYIKSVLAFDKALSKRSTLKIIGLEQKLSFTLKLGDGTSVLLKGKLDRIDELDGQLRLIDYKTGSVENSGLNLSQFDDLYTNKKYDKAFQLLCYAFLYANKESRLPDQAAILPIKQLNKGLLTLKVDRSAQLSMDHLERFKLGLIKLIEEILNPDIPFIDVGD